MSPCPSESAAKPRRAASDGLLEGLSGDQRQQEVARMVASLQIIGETDGKKPSKCSGLRGESPSGKGGRIALQHSESVQTRHVVLGTLPCVSESGCKIGEKCRFRHAEVDGQPIEKSKNGGVRGSVSLLKVSIQLGCSSRLPPEQICFAEKGENWDQITLLQGHVAPHQNSGKNGSIARSYSKVRAS